MVNQKTYNWEDINKRSLLRSMLMTSCDISAICKPWPVQQRVAHLVAEEFFQQGDLEQKELHQTPIEMMDRAKKDKLPKMQVGFIDNICLPVYQHLAEQYSYFQPLVEECINNRHHWTKLFEQQEKLKAEHASNNNNKNKVIEARRPIVKSNPIFVKLHKR